MQKWRSLERQRRARFWFIASVITLLSISHANAEQRFAFIVDNYKYINSASLRNPPNDAARLSEHLAALNFKVVRRSNLTAVAFAAEIDSFVRSIASGGSASSGRTVLFYYAGHGMQYEGHNYLVGTDASLDSVTRLRFETFMLDDVLDTLERHSDKTLVFWDACRSNPLLSRFRNALAAGNRTRSAETVRAAPAVIDGRSGNTLVAFSAAPGTVALDGDADLSPFAEALSRHIPTENVEIEVMLKRVARDVLDRTSKKQKPERVSQLVQDFYFNLNQSESRRLEQQVLALEQKIANIDKTKGSEGDAKSQQDTPHLSKDQGVRSRKEPQANQDAPANGLIAPLPRDESSSIDRLPVTVNYQNVALPRRLARDAGSRTLAVGTEGGAVWLLHLPDLTVKKRLQFGEDRISDLDFSPDGKFLAVASRDGRLVMWDIDGDRESAVFAAGGQAIYSVSINPDFPDKYVAAGGGNGNAFAWALRNGEQVTNSSFHDGAIHKVGYKVGAKSYFLTGGADGLIRYRVDGGERQALKAHAGAVFDFAFSGSQNYFVSVGGDRLVKIWRDFPSSTVSTAMEGHLKYFLAVAVSVDGKKIASGGGDKSILLWSYPSASLQGADFWSWGRYRRLAISGGWRNSGFSK